MAVISWIMLHVLLFSMFLMIEAQQKCNFRDKENDNDCVIFLVLLPFTDRYQQSTQLPVSLPFSHMAASLMAIEHFNTRNPAVVDELASDEFAYTNCAKQLAEGKGIVWDDGDFATIATRDLLLAEDLADESQNNISAVVGPYNNRPIQGVGYITGAMNAPLVSYHADSSEIGQPLAYPLTSKNTVDEYSKAYIVLDYLTQYRGRDYIALLYDTGLLEIQKNLQTIARIFEDPINFTSEAIETTIGAPIDGNHSLSVRAALERIKESGYLTVIVAVDRMEYWDVIVDVANEYGMSGPDSGYFWMSYDTSNLEMLTQPTISSNRANLLNGAGMVKVLDNFAYKEDDRFLQSWRSYGNNSTFVKRLNDLNPIEYNQTTGVADPGYYFAEDDYFLKNNPEPAAGFIYDSLIALGMAKCRAKNYNQNTYSVNHNAKFHHLELDTYPFTLVLNEFFNSLVVNTSFSGASGDVVLHGGNGTHFTRNYESMAYGIYNIRLQNQSFATNISNNGTILKEFDNVLTAVWNNNTNWTDFNGSEFVFADGTSNEPKPFKYVPSNPPDENLALILCLILGLLSVAIVFIVLYIYKRKEADSMWKIKASELHFGDPPEVIGSGTFGYVVLAEYKGTQVAVKRVTPPRAVKEDLKGHAVSMVKSVFGQGVDTGVTSELSKNDINKHFDIHDEEGIDMSTLRPVQIDVMEPIQHKQEGGALDSPSSNGFRLHKSNEKNQIFSAKGLKHSTYERMKDDFRAEIRQLSKLRHPCITTVMGAVVNKHNEPMLVMEYMEHGSLYDLLHNDTLVLDGDLLLPILRDITHGIRFLHAHSPQIIHGDLKAQNILVDSRFRAKVADFGLTKRVGADSAGGTPYFMAPELLRKDTDRNAATDAYSFGILLYEVYSRKDPYEGEEYREVLRMVSDPTIHKRPPVPQTCPPLVQSIMTECLVEEPSDRPPFEELDIRLKRLSVETVDPMASLQCKKQAKKDTKRMAELLSDVFPPHIAQALRDGRKVEPEHRDIVTIFFCDIVGFTTISSTLEPIQISHMLDRLYNKFDHLSRKHDVFKVETIGDAYMAVTNLIKDQREDHARRIADFSIEALEAANETLIDADDPDKGFVNIRVGFHSGPVVANVVGSRNPRYCLFGDTVNTASRMESNSQRNRIQCSPHAARILKEQYPDLRLKPRGAIEIKGKGKMHTYWVNEGQSILLQEFRASDHQVNEEHPVDARRKSYSVKM